MAAATDTFRGGVFIPPSSSLACSSSSRTRYYLEPTSLLDLHLQPPKVPDLWRIEGGGPDLHLHRRNFISLSICLGNSFLFSKWGSPSLCIRVMHMAFILLKVVHRQVLTSYTNHGSHKVATWMSQVVPWKH
jgi:hypothetical protein